MTTREHLLECTSPPRIVVFYSLLSTETAIVSKELLKKF